MRGGQLLGAAVTLIVAATCGLACSDVGAVSGGSASTGAGGAGPAMLGPAMLAHPPPPPPENPGDGPGVVLAINRLYFGDTTRDGAPNAEADATAWRAYGFDLDGRASTKASKDLCQPRDEAYPANVYPDGNAGIDNSFGRNVMQVFFGAFAGAGAGFSSKVDKAILDGTFTMLLQIEKLGPQSSYNPLAASIYQAADRGGPPAFDGTDVWPVRAESLLDPENIESAKVMLSKSYVTGDTWVSGPEDVTIELPIPLDALLDDSPPIPEGARLWLRIHHAVVTVSLDASHGSGRGTIAGILDHEELAHDFSVNLGYLCCGGCTFDALLTQFYQASDILLDGTQDPTKTCDGISIGLGFDASAAQLGGVAPETPLGCGCCSP